MINFQEWLSKKNSQNCGKPKPPSKMKKLHRKETFSTGVRDLRNDLSKDYPGNLDYHGDVGPYKIKS